MNNQNKSQDRDQDNTVRNNQGRNDKGEFTKQQQQHSGGGGQQGDRNNQGSKQQANSVDPPVH